MKLPTTIFVPKGQSPEEASAVIRALVSERDGLRRDLLAIIDAAGEVRMFEGRSYRKLWRLLDAATDRWLRE